MIQGQKFLRLELILSLFQRFERLCIPERQFLRN
jgi:hypothetical protein